jgi:hypothetical protein
VVKARNLKAMDITGSSGINILDTIVHWSLPGK